mmetsp:Transcript_1432/g.3626  ORF Transcript_1432/g.3626 Transcript_1432/m.3626 type:complete len:87 (-) Transcript_1432:1079-1339(-)
MFENDCPGANINQQGGMCIHGRAYGYLKKIEVGAAYNAAKDANGGLSQNMSALERACKVGLYFVVKCETEMAEYGRIIPSFRDPAE